MAYPAQTIATAQRPSEEPQDHIDRLARHNAATLQGHAWHSATLRFENGEPCCTTTYNKNMPPEQRNALARRIAAALNLTRHLRTEQMEEMIANRQTRILDRNGPC